MPIQKLPDTLIAQIAAGEVIERPSSIIKELIDNSIDAGASSIKVYLKGGGIEQIVVQDDGCGISKEDLQMAFEAHATSKIRTQDDLLKVLSMGFRGEALASIQGVSEVHLTTYQKDSPCGWSIKASASAVSDPTPIAPTAVGTKIQVDEIFFHIPARRKFLKSPAFEYQKCKEVFLRFALAYPHVSFSLFKDGKQQYVFAPSSLKERMMKIIGEPQNHLMQKVYVKHSEQNVCIEGFVAAISGLPSHKEVQYLFINGRYIKDKGLSHAIKTATAHLKLPKDNAFVLHISMPAEFVDVNAHPAKVEVRFKDNRLVYQWMYEAITEALKSQPVNGGLKSQETLDSKIRPQDSNNEEALFDAPASQLIANQLGVSIHHTDSAHLTKVSSGVLPKGWLLLETHGGFWVIKNTLWQQISALIKVLNSTDLKVSKPLVAPLVLNLTAEQKAVVHSHASYLKSLGIIWNQQSEGIEITHLPQLMGFLGLKEGLGVFELLQVIKKTQTEWQIWFELLSDGAAQQSILALEDLGTPDDQKVPLEEILNQKQGLNLRFFPTE